jgi:hypothetical protein
MASQSLKNHYTEHSVSCQELNKRLFKLETKIILNMGVLYPK